MDFVAVCKECEWFLTQGSKEDVTYFGKRHSKDFSHKVEFREEYEDDANVYEPGELLQDKGNESEQYLDGDFNSRDRFTS
jgi:hypothetical protein